jgi:hypothetical protein
VGGRGGLSPVLLSLCRKIETKDFFILNLRKSTLIYYQYTLFLQAFAT